MLNRNFHRSLRPGANRGVPATLSPKFAAAKSFNSGIAERSEAANGPCHQKPAGFQALFANFYFSKQDYFGA
jgi:hypothetical protein